MRQYGDVSFEVPGTASPGWGAIRRAYVKDSAPYGIPLQNDPGKFCLTSYENFIHASDTFGPNRCLGYRPVNAKGVAGQFKWHSYAEVRRMVEDFSAGLVKLGLCPKSVGDHEIREQAVLGIMMRNRPEWHVAEQACYLQRMIPIPFYDSAKSDTLRAIVSQIKSLKAIVCTQQTMGELIKSKREQASLSITHLISVDEISIDFQTAAAAVGLTLVPFALVMKQGAAGERLMHTPPSPDDIYTFCFTSGTTGEPKGALITHRNIIANSAALSDRMVQWSIGSECLLSYLPLPHMFERVCQLLAVTAGSGIGFSQGDPLKLVDDLQALRPTRFVGVPRVLNRMQERVMAQVTQEGGVKARVFNLLLNRKLSVSNDPISVIFSDKIVFPKIAIKLGLDRVKQILTGSAPIAPSTLRWFRAVFPNVAVNEGYGQTECTLVCSLQNPFELTAGDCGAPLSCCDVRLMDVPEMGYRSSDKQHGKIACLGRGEICIRGDNVFKGYYKEPGKTRETIDEQGWLHTGDIGMWTAQGQLKIIDRKKNIFKLSQGEYVAPEKIEAVFATCKFVLQAFVYGDSLRDHLVAVVVPNPDAIREWCLVNTVEEKDVEKLCEFTALKAAVLAELTARSREAKLHGFEIVKNVFLEPQLWTAENLLTPTFKLKRKDAERKYKTQIDRMYHQCATSKL